MSVWVPHGFDSREAWRRHVTGRGCYDAQENERIFDKWYARAPRVVFRRADSTYGLRDKTVCDVGCCYGANLFFTRPGSYGLEMNEAYVNFARGVGLPVHKRNVVEDDLEDLPRVDAVWCSAVVPKTLRFTCERAGFETVELTALYRRPFSALSRRLFLPATCLYVGRAREGWDYPANAGRRAARNARGFVGREPDGAREAEGDE